MSSGQYLTTTPRHVECDGTSTHMLPLFSPGGPIPVQWPCKFEGEVDVDVDPEVKVASWECPRCNTVHDFPWADLVGSEL